MDYRRNGNIVYIRMDKGEEIVSGIDRICEREHIVSGSFFGIGCCSKATIFSRFPDTMEDKPHSREDCLEMEHLAGTISVEDDGSIVQHSHAVFTYIDMKREQHVFAGHLLSAEVLYTAEITMFVSPEPIRRMTDPITGIRVIRLSDESDEGGESCDLSGE